MSLLNLNLTIKEHQYPMIVRELVDTFPNESIQDFQLCFKNGVTGKYGKIYNVDLSVLGTWMGEYLEEKYQYLESNSSQPETEPLPGVDYEAFKKRKAAMESLEAQAKDQAFKAERERQMKEMGFGEFKHGYKPDPEKAKEILLREQWRRDTYDPIKQGPGISFEEWLTKQ